MSQGVQRYLDVIHAAGVSTAPSIGAAIEAGAVAVDAGWYDVEWQVAAFDTLAVGKGIVIEHRNAANSTTTRQLGGCSAGGQEYGRARLLMAASERVRAIAGPVAGAASSYYVVRISLQRVS